MLHGVWDLWSLKFGLGFEANGFALEFGLYRPYGSLNAGICAAASFQRRVVHVSYLYCSASDAATDIFV